jgi:hypothetical protein
MSDSLPIEADDAATAVSWTDRFACTIIARTPKSITVQYDHATLLNDANSGEPDAIKVYTGGFAAHFEGTQRYRYERNTEGRIEKYTLRKNGKWKRVGVGSNERGGYLIVGKRSHHYDYNF